MWDKRARKFFFTYGEKTASRTRSKAVLPLEANDPVTIEKGPHLFPSRTQKLSLSSLMVLGGQPPGRVSRRRIQSWPLGQAVKTPPFHGGNRGSIPLGVTKFLIIWELSSAGRAPAWRAGGHRFESCSPHHGSFFRKRGNNRFLKKAFSLRRRENRPCLWLKVIHYHGLVVQLVRTLACHARGRGFESLPGRHICRCSSIGRATDL